MLQISKFIVLGVLSLLLMAAVAAFLWPLLFGKAEPHFFPDVQFGSPLETSTETIDFKMEGLTIRAPANRLVAMIRGSDYWSGELKGGFSFEAMWPDFAPRTAENIEDFRENTDDWGVLTFTFRADADNQKYVLKMAGDARVKVL